MSRPSRAGVICWRGPSLLTGAPIAVVLTGLDIPSRNSKTGPMVQAYIVPDGIHAGLAVGTEAERAVCGDCPLRGTKKTRVCYVSWGVWVVGRQMAAGRFSEVTLGAAADLLYGRSLRIGAYGDPAAAPTFIWDRLVQHSNFWTGYTHQWRTCDQHLSSLLMASVETHEQREEAHARGWRTFRIRWAGAPPGVRELVCLAEKYPGVTCDKCFLCCGRRFPKAKDIVITAHGLGEVRYSRQFRQLALQLM